MRTLLTSGVLSVLSLGFASALSSPSDAAPAQLPVLAAQPGEQMVMTKATESVTAKVGRDVVGSDLVLSHYATKLRGMVEGQATELRWDAGGLRITGAFGDRPVNLALSGGADTLVIRGHFGTRAVDLRVSPVKIDGVLGPCSYAMRLDGDRYKGEVSCGAAPVAASLQVPSSLAAKPRPELAAILVSVMAM